MFKSVPSAFRSLRHIAEGKNRAGGFDGPSSENYDFQGGTPRAAQDVSHGEYVCNVQDSLAQTPIPSKSIKAPFKG